MTCEFISTDMAGAVTACPAAATATVDWGGAYGSKVLCAEHTALFDDGSGHPAVTPLPAAAAS